MSIVCEHSNKGIRQLFDPALERGGDGGRPNLVALFHGMEVVAAEADQAASMTAMQLQNRFIPTKLIVRTFPARIIVRDRVRLLALLGGLDHGVECLFGLAAAIEQQGRAPDPGGSIINAPERDAGDVLLVLEENRKNLGILLREFPLGFRRGRVRVHRTLPADPADIGAAIPPSPRADVQLCNHHLDAGSSQTRDGVLKTLGAGVCQRTVQLDADGINADTLGLQMLHKRDRSIALGL